MNGFRQWQGVLIGLGALAIIGLIWWQVADTTGDRGAPSTRDESAEATVWNYSVWGPKRAFTSGAERAAELLQEATDGRLKIKFHYAGALTPAREGLDGLKLGLLEAAHICFAYHPMKVPLTHVLALPFLLTEDDRINVRVTDAVFRHPAVQRDLRERWNVVYLAPAVLPAYEFMGNTRVARVEDLAGTRLRVPGDYANLFQSIEAVQVMVTAPETYTALERGTVDLVAFPWTDSFGAFRLHEVSGYATEGLRIPPSGCMSAVRQDAWDALPQEVRKRLPEIREAAIETYLEANAAADRHWRPEFEKTLEIVPFPPEERQRLVELSGPHWQAWAEEMDARGLAGSEMLRFVQAEIARLRQQR